MHLRITTPFRKSCAPALAFLLMTTAVYGQKPSGAASLREVAADYQPWQHLLLASLLTGTIALAVIFALHNRKSHKLIDMHRTLNARMRKTDHPPTGPARDAKSRWLHSPKDKR